MHTPEPTRIADIVIPDGRRAVNEAAVERLRESFRKIGLHTPISIRVVESMVVDGQETMNVPVLVAGRHRLEAARLEGWEKIETIEIDGDEIAAELWEISENLHRADLSKDERDKCIRRFAELLAHQSEVQSGQVVRIESKRDDGRGHRQEGAAAKIAKETGLSQRTVRRALAEPDDVKPAATSKIDRDVKTRAAREVAEMLSEHVPADWWDALKANLYAAGASNIAAELTNITGQSIMDRRYGS